MLVSLPRRRNEWVIRIRKRRYNCTHARCNCNDENEKSTCQDCISSANITPTHQHQIRSNLFFLLHNADIYYSVTGSLHLDTVSTMTTRPPVHPSTLSLAFIPFCCWLLFHLLLHSYHKYIRSPLISVVWAMAVGVNSEADSFIVSSSNEDFSCLL